MSKNCIRCGFNSRTGFDLLCDDCRQSMTPPTPTPEKRLSEERKAELLRTVTAYPNTVLALEVRSLLAELAAKDRELADLKKERVFNRPHHKLGTPEPHALLTFALPPEDAAPVADGQAQGEDGGEEKDQVNHDR